MGNILVAVASSVASCLSSISLSVFLFFPSPVALISLPSEFLSSRLLTCFLLPLLCIYACKAWICMSTTTRPKGDDSSSLGYHRVVVESPDISHSALSAPPRPVKHHVLLPLIRSLPARCLFAVWLFSVMLSAVSLCVVVNSLVWAVLYPLLWLNKKTYYRLIEHSTSKVFGLFGLLLVSCFPFWSVNVVNAPPPGYSPKRTVIMCNHMSNADGYILVAKLFPWNLKIIYKGSLGSIPILGWALRLSRCIPVHFTAEKGGWGTERGSVASMMRQCKEVNELNVPVLVFPEGTRSSTGRLQPFKDGFFKYAIENKVEIFPMVIHNSNYAWPNGSMLPNLAGIELAYGTRVDAEGVDISDLKKRIKDEMTVLLKKCPSYDPKIDAPVEVRNQKRGQGLF